MSTELLLLYLEGPKSGKRIMQIDDNDKIVRTWNGSRELVEAGFTKAKIYGACSQGHKYKGYHWKYSGDYFDYSANKAFKLIENKKFYYD